jgi:hypothetical protein
VGYERAMFHGVAGLCAEFRVFADQLATHKNLGTTTATP